ncbi:MAG: LysR substrate-binding domain-containing protein [Woeseiaceae bacterium]
MKTPTIKQLRYFIALTETEHFGQAAEACFVSQSAFSNAIKELETLLGVQLVDRTNRSVTIAAVGQQIASHARLVLQDLESLVEVAEGRGAPLTGELRLGVIPTIAPFVLPTLLPKLRKAYPELKLFLIEDQTQRVYERLQDGEVDLLLLALPWPMRSAETLTLYKDRFCLAARPNYTNDGVLLLEDGHCLRDHALDACRIRNAQKIQPFGASSLLTLVEMVDADLGITFLPEMAKGTTLLKNTRVKLTELPESSHRSIGLAWRKGSARVEEFKLFGEFLKKNRKLTR